MRIMRAQEFFLHVHFTFAPGQLALEEALETNMSSVCHFSSVTKVNIHIEEEFTAMKYMAIQLRWHGCIYVSLIKNKHFLE